VSRIERRILLEDYRVAVSIGIYDFERETPQTVIVNVVLELADDWRDPEDRIERALDYDVLHDGIAALVKGRHFNLQETLCREILQFCLKQPGLKRVRVSTRKPDIYPDCKSIGFEIEAALPGFRETGR
jgi:dihydroneopterin aldolase